MYSVRKVVRLFVLGVVLTLAASPALLPLSAAAQTPPTQPPVPSTPAQPAAPSTSQPPAPLGQTQVLSIPPVQPVPSVGGGAPLTLLDAVRRALEQNLGVRAAAIGVAIARTQVTQAEAGLYPTVGLAASNTQQTAPGNSVLNGTINIAGVVSPFTAIVPGSATPQWNVRGTVNWALYTGNAVQDQIAIAKANLRGQQSAFTATAAQTVLAVRQAYYTYVQSEGQVAAAQRAVDASRENVRVTQAQVTVGTSPQFNLLQAQVQLAQAQRTLTQQKAAAVAAEQQLAAVLNLPIATAIRATTPLGLPTPPPDVEGLVKQALGARPEIAQGQAAIEAAQGAVDLAGAGLRPVISLSGGPQILSNNLGTNSNVTWAGTLQVTLAIFDGGLTPAKVAQARQQLALARVQLEQTQQTVEVQVRAAYLNLQQAAEQLASAQAGLVAAQEALRIANVRFTAGVGTQLEVVTAIQNLATADAAVVQALFQYNLALAQIDQAIGSPVAL